MMLKIQIKAKQIKARQIKARQQDSGMQYKTQTAYIVSVGQRGRAIYAMPELTGPSYT